MAASRKSPRRRKKNGFEPDWEKLRALSVEIDELQRAGRWTKAEFQRVLDESAAATNDDPELIEFVVNAGFLAKD
jgi:hypothetical protein